MDWSMVGSLAGLCYKLASHVCEWHHQDRQLSVEIGNNNNFGCKFFSKCCCCVWFMNERIHLLEISVSLYVFDLIWFS